MINGNEKLSFQIIIIFYNKKWINISINTQKNHRLKIKKIYHRYLKISSKVNVAY